jgi:hypothetical protein
VAYWHRRYEELAGTRPLPPRVIEAKPPLTWESYSTLLKTFQRSLEFQRAVTRWLLKDALLKRAPRHGVELHFYVP